MINSFLKKKLKKILIAMLLITYFSCYISLAAEMDTDNLTKLSSNIAVWKNIDSADIVLANGQNISNIATTREVEISEIEEINESDSDKDICVYLLIDGSVKEDSTGNCWKTIRNGCESAILSLWDEVEEQGKNMKVIVKGVQWMPGNLPIGWNKAMTRNEFLDLMKIASEGKYRSDTREGDDSVWNELQVELSGIDSNTVKPIVFWATDGFPVSDAGWNKWWEYSDAERIIEGMIDQYGMVLSIGIAYNSFWNRRGLPAGWRYPLGAFQSTDWRGGDTDIQWEWTFGGRASVYFMVSEKLGVDLNSWYDFMAKTFSVENLTVINDKKSVIKSKKGFFETAKGYNAIVDEEILYGATLTVDYSIHVQTKETLSKINIKDYIPEGMQVVSTDPGGTYQPNDNTVTFDIKEKVAGEKVVKLTLSKVLASADDIQEMENTADVTVTTEDGKIYPEISDDLPDEKKENIKEEYRLHSKKLSIIPPFGSSNAEKTSISNNIIVKHWKSITVAIAWIIVIAYFTRTIRINRDN